MALGEPRKDTGINDYRPDQAALDLGHASEGVGFFDLLRRSKRVAGGRW